MRVQANRWQRWLPLALAALFLTAHTVALLTSTTPGESSRAAAAVVATVDGHLCEVSHPSGGGHESCADPDVDHCPTSLSGSTGFALDPDGLPVCGSNAAASTIGLPRSADRAVSLAQLQVWRH